MFDADSGKNGGGIVRTITGDHNDRITDLSALILIPVEKEIVNSSGNDIAGTIDSHYYLGCGARGGVEREVIAYKIIKRKSLL